MYVGDTPTDGESTAWVGAPDGFTPPSPDEAAAADGPMMAVIPGLPDLRAGCGFVKTGVAFDGSFYYVAEGASNNMCIDRFSLTGAFLDAKRFPPDFRGLHYVPATGKLVGRTYGGAGGQLWQIDYAAGTASRLTGYNVRPCNVQSQPAADPDGVSFWIWDVECGGSTNRAERHRLSNNALLSSFPVTGTHNFTGGALGVSTTRLFVPNNASVNIYDKSTGAFVANQPLSANTMSCFGYGFGVSAGADRIGYDIDCNGGVRVEALAPPLDVTAPVIVATVTGTLGNNDWYTSNVNVSWSVTDPESGIASQTGCGAVDVTDDTAGQTFTCSATNGVGLSSSESVTIKRDATDPLIGYSGNAASYTVDETVAITCSASDAMSGLASNTCADINGAAYTFGLGSHTFSATATDNAGNDASASVTFTVGVTYTSLCALTQQWVDNPGIAHALCAKLDAAAASAARGNNNSKAGQLGAYANQLNAQAGKSISAEHAAILIALSAAL